MGAQTFTFSTIPSNVDELKAMPEFQIDTPYKTAAISVVVLLNFEANPDACFAMLDALKGPAPTTPYEKQFITERLKGKGYKVSSFFQGATPENGYVASSPLTITVSDNPYSFPEENWAVMFVTSSGADSPRQIKLRKKPSTGEWFLNELQCLSDIRVPVAEDPWA